MKNAKTTPCKACIYMLRGLRAKTDGNNRHRGGGRIPCYCEHPAARETFDRVCPKSHKMPGFIGYTHCGKNDPQIKTSPTWCPLRPENKKEAAARDV